MSISIFFQEISLRLSSFGFGVHMIPPGKADRPVKITEEKIANMLKEDEIQVEGRMAKRHHRKIEYTRNFLFVREGFEPSSSDPQSEVLPLNYNPLSGGRSRTG